MVEFFLSLAENRFISTLSIAFVLYFSYEIYLDISDIKKYKFYKQVNKELDIIKNKLLHHE